MVNCLYIPLFYSKRKYELCENGGVLIALVDIFSLYLFFLISVPVCTFLCSIYISNFASYLVFYLYYLYFVFFLFRYRFRQYKLLF